MIKEINISSLNAFQIEIWYFFIFLFEKLKYEKLSDKSTIDEVPFIDVILRLSEDDFVLNLSIRKDVFVVNSNYFDIYVYPEIPLSTISILLTEIFSGNYYVFYSYGKKKKLIRKEVVFENSYIKEFNQKNNMTIFNKKIITVKKIKGCELVN